MLTIKDPLTFYWLQTSGILKSIKSDLQDRLEVKITFDSLRIRSEGKTSTLQVISQLNKQIQEKISSFKIQSLDNVSQESYNQITKILRQKYSKDKLTIINCEYESKDIKSIIIESELSKGLHQYKNYYELQNMTYIFAHEDIVDDVLRMFTKNQLNDSLNQETVYYSKPDVKVEDVLLGTKIGQFEGGELWNCKYKNIPHTYIRFKDSAWQEGAKKNILHTSHPKYLSGLNLCPPLQKLKPSKDKLPQLLSFLKTLERTFPNHYPTIDSFFQSNGKLMIFTKQNNYRVNMGWLCYRVMYGQISYQGYLRWVKHNPQDEISKYNTTKQQIYEYAEI